MKHVSRERGVPDANALQLNGRDSPCVPSGALAILREVSYATRATQITNRVNTPSIRVSRCAKPGQNSGILEVSCNDPQQDNATTG